MSDDTKKPEAPHDQPTVPSTSSPAQRTLFMAGAVPPPKAADPNLTQPLVTPPAKVTDPNATQALVTPPPRVTDPQATQPLVGTPLTVEPPPPLPPPAPPPSLAGMPTPSWGSHTTQRDTIVGQELGGYEVLRRLAEGGMGVVYEGRHTKLGRRAAIKVLKAEYCTSENVVERFHQEARAVNEIHHENIVDVYDFGRDRDGRVFFVMEFLEGESLGARLGRGPLPFAGALPILEQVIRALKAAHDKGFAHRDLKPDNIWLKTRDDHGVDVRLLDFGIAKLLGSEAPQERLTRTGAIIGTPTYMSPEQINGAQSLDARTDIYSLGIIIYELFAGVTPFQGENLAAIMMGHLLNEPPPLQPAPGLGVPEAVGQIVARMLAKKPDERYQTVSEVLGDLRAVAQNREPSVASKLDRELPRTLATGVTGASSERTAPTVSDRPAPEPAPAAPARRNKLLIPLIAIAVAGAAAAAFFATRSGDDAAAPSAAGTPSAPSDPATPGEPQVLAGQAEPPPGPPAIDYQQAGRDARVVLRAALGDPEPRVRVHGSDGVGAVKDGDSEPRLLELAIQDPDAEVRGHAASALAALGATGARDALARAEKAAPAPLRVWYAGALAQLGERDARKRLVKYARDEDLAVAFRATLMLGELGEPGDDDAIDALQRLAAREAELNDVAPYAGAVLLTKLAGLRHERARTVLYQLLDSDNERARLAAAEGLARLGDEAALAPLQRTLADQASPNRLVAAVALIGLGDYTGFELLGDKLADPEPEIRRLAARGLGEVGEKDSVAALLPLLEDADGAVRVATAVALVFIVGLDPRLLAQASIDWAKGALTSEDWAVRQAAAGVLGDLAEEEAVPLLAQAIVDPDKKVRRAAARSARKLKGADAGKVVADAALAETDPEVQADQVRALGTIADPGTLAALRVLAEERGTVGVLASGSLIAVGDPAGKARLDQAIVDRKVELREIAIEASALARDPVVVPTLVVGARDRVFAVRFAAAEVLGQYQAEAALATPVLEEGLTQKSLAIQGRARAALIGFGVAPSRGATPADLLDSLDPEVRKGAAREVEQLGWDQARPLVRRMLADPDPAVRLRGLEVVEARAPERRELIKLYKGVVEDGDPGVRFKAKARLARIVEPLTTTPGPATPPPATPPPDAQPAAAAAPDAGVTVDKTAVDDAAAEAAEALAEAQAAAAGIEPIAQQLAAAIDEPADDDANVRKVVSLVRDAKDLRDQVTAASARARKAADAAAKAAKAAPSAQATERAAAARQAADAAAALARQLVAATDKLDDQADEYASDEGDIEVLLSSADSALAAGKLSEAKRDLDKADKMAKASGGSYPAIKFSYGRLYDAQASRAKRDEDRLPLLKRAKQSYDGFVSRGAGAKVGRARERSQELAEEIAEIEGAAP